jgi:hypothetical protein
MKWARLLDEPSKRASAPTSNPSGVTPSQWNYPAGYRITRAFGGCASQSLLRLIPGTDILPSNLAMRKGRGAPRKPNNFRILAE